MNRRALAALALTLGIAVANQAHAGNAETFYLGTDAALLAGAVSASTQGASALWYNPARIQEGRADSIDLSGSAYVLQFGGNPDIKAAKGERATREKLVVRDFSAVPTALAFKRRIFGVELGAGLFVPNRTVAYPRTLVRVYPSNGAGPTEVAFAGSERFTEYYGGLGFGGELGPGISIGGALFGYFSSSVSTLAIGARNDTTFVGRNATFDEDKLGLQAVTGLAWKIAPRVRVGFVLRSPVVQLLGQTQESEMIGAYGPGGQQSSIDFREDALSTTRSKILTPLRAEAGTAIDVAKDTTVAVDLKMRGALSSTELGRVADPTTDIRAGIRHRVSSDVWLGGGLFTDTSSAPRRNTTADTAIDFYGITLAVELGSPYRVVDREGDRKTLRFSTTIALNYALGLGSIGNVEVGAAQGPISLASKREDVVAHEFMFMLGSTLSSAR